MIRIILADMEWILLGGIQQADDITNNRCVSMFAFCKTMSDKSR